MKTVRFTVCTVLIIVFSVAFAAAMKLDGKENARPSSDPLQDLRFMHEKMNRVVDEVYGRLGMTERDVSHPGALGYYPEVDVSEDDAEVIVRVDLPGVEKDKIDIGFSEGNLVITGVREVVKERHEHAGWFMRERYFGSFERVIPIYPKIRDDGIRADYKDGVLSIILPKAEQKAPAVKKIKIL